MTEKRMIVRAGDHTDVLERIRYVDARIKQVLSGTERGRYLQMEDCQELMLSLLHAVSGERKLSKQRARTYKLMTEMIKDLNRMAKDTETLRTKEVLHGLQDELKEVAANVHRRKKYK